MTFLNPLLLFGAFAVASPIIIHLLAKSRIKKVVWAAMRFVQPIVQRTQRKMNLEDLILLLLRCALLALLALALARPSWRSGALGAPSGSEAALLLVDNSASMGQTDGTKTRFEKAQQAAEQLLDALPSGSTVAVWFVSDVVRTAIPEPSRDFALARKLLRNSRRSDHATDLLPALRRGLEVLARQQGSHKRLYVFTDGQASGWKQLAEARALLAGAKNDTPARIFLVGDMEPHNLAVTSLRLGSALAPVNESLRFEVEVSNFGREDARGVPVSLGLDDEPPADEASLDLIPAGESRHLSLFARFRDPGFHTVSARIAADRAPADDERVAALRVTDAIDVLLVDGEPGAEPRESEVFYLRNALAPVPAEQREKYFIKPRVISPGEFDTQRLSDFQAVFLANVVDLSEAAVVSLEKYVKAGGGLVVFPGTRISTAFYNKQLFADRPILPASFGAARGDADQQEKFRALQNKGYVHPIVSVWQDPAAGNLGTAHFFRAFDLEPDPAARGAGGPPALVLKYDDGLPAVMERSYGDGRVIQFSSTADAAWNDLPARPVYLPLVHRVLGALLARQDERLNLRVGARFSYLTDVSLAGKDASIVKPGGKDTTIRRVELVNGLPTLTFDETDTAGAYAVKTSDDAQPMLRFAAQPAAEESNLAELTPEDLKTFDGAAQVERWTGEISLREQMTRERTGRELWFAVALLALGVAVAETVLAHRFSQPK